MKDHNLQPINIDPYELRANRPADTNLTEFAANLRHYRDRLVVLLGAGASVGARGGEPLNPLPSALFLRNEIWKEYMLPPEGFDFNELGMLSLDQAAAFAVTKVGRTIVTDYIARRFSTFQPLWQHAVLPFLNPRAIFTTNYDQLIEQGWQQHRDRLSLVPIFDAGQRVQSGRVPIYKPHGSCERTDDPVGSGGPVITTIDYFSMLSKKRRMLSEWLSTAANACVLLIGYSMSDMDIGSELYELRRRSGLNWYSVFPRTDADVRRYWSEQLNIRPIDRRFAEFLSDLDDIIGFVPPSWKHNQIDALIRAGVIQPRSA